MIWYNNEILVDDDHVVNVTGIIEDSVVKIMVNGQPKFEKAINMWAYQEILPEDVLAKYEGKVRKIEGKIPDWIASGRLVLD